VTGQDASLDEQLTGTQNLVLVGELAKLPRRAARLRAAELLERFELTDAAGRLVKTYSGGMRRRLDLAASLVTSPPVLFLDEPTTGLDPTSRLRMWDVIRELVADGTTLLLTTQYLDEADALADAISVIDHGIVIAHGSARELKARVGGEQLEVTLAQRDGAAGAAAAALAPIVAGSVHVSEDGWRLTARSCRSPASSRPSCGRSTTPAWPSTTSRSTGPRSTTSSSPSPAGRPAPTRRVTYRPRARGGRVMSTTVLEQPVDVAADGLAPTEAVDHRVSPAPPPSGRATSPS